MMIRGPAYDCCSACSVGIVEEFRTKGWEFIKRALNEKGHVEEVCGLKEVQRLAEQAGEEVDWDSEEEKDEVDGEIV